MGDTTMPTDQTITLDAIVTFLDTTPLFEQLDAAERGEVVRVMEVRHLTTGEEIFHEGDPGDGWYVVFEGRARVLKETPTGRQEIAVLGPGTCFGEMAILDGLPRSADVEATGRLTVLRFPRERFQELLDHGSLGAYKLVAALARVLSQRHRELTQHRSGIENVIGRYQVSE